MTPADERGPMLLALAREAVAAAAAGLPEPSREPAAEEHPPWLLERRATFVTLRLGGELRGCIGTIEAWLPLVADVRRNGHGAATRDPRFPQVAPAELDLLAVEVSLLSPLERLQVRGRRELATRLSPGVDGVVLRQGPASGTFLPQVWEQLPDPRDFLARLEEKAGVRWRRWGPDVEVWRYRVEKWEEAASR